MSGLSNFLGNVSGEKDEPDDEVLDADENFESAPPELPDLGNWFDALEDATPSVAEFPAPPSLIHWPTSPRRSPTNRRHPSIPWRFRHRRRRW